MDKNTITKPIAFVCGGTGGHVYPAIALAQELNDKPLFFIGSTDRQDKDIIKRYGFDFVGIAPKKTSLIQKISTFFKAARLLKDKHVQHLVSTGGGQTAFVALAAFFLRIPITLLEQNTIPGRTNRILQFFATTIILTFPESLPYFYVKKRCQVLGNPVRKSFLSDALSEKIINLTIPDLPVILFFGGSQGALKLNQFITNHYPDCLNSPFVTIHITGEGFFKTQYGSEEFILQKDVNGHIKIITLPYFEKMDWLYTLSSLIICRAGATTLSELKDFQKYGIFVPFPFAKDNHQFFNAKSMSEQGYGVLIEENALHFSDIERELKTAVSAKKDSSPASARTIIADHIRKQLS